MLLPRIWFKKEEKYHPGLITELSFILISNKIAKVKINEEIFDYNKIELDNFLNCHAVNGTPIYENDILYHHIDLNIVATQEICKDDPYRLITAKSNFNKLQKKTHTDRGLIIANKRLVLRDLRYLHNGDLLWYKKDNCHQIYVNNYEFIIERDMNKYSLIGKYLLPKTMLPAVDDNEAIRMATDAIFQGFSMLFGQNLPTRKGDNVLCK